VRSFLAITALLAFAACRGAAPESRVVTLPGSALGAEAEVLRIQLARFMEHHPEIRVVQRRTPDAADQRHQLYVQWLNAWADDPDILQLDVIWTPEFAAAGWLLPLDRFEPDVGDFFPATLARPPRRSAGGASSRAGCSRVRATRGSSRSSSSSSPPTAA
jgi:multiple sugar transport system substrate-binding protein